MTFDSKKLKRFVSDWQDALIWLPVIAVVVYTLYTLIPRIDPRSGIDGFGDLFHASVNILKGVLVTFFAWLSKRVYFFERSDSDLRNTSPDEYRTDRLEWLLWLIFWFAVVFMF